MDLEKQKEYDILFTAAIYECATLLKGADTLVITNINPRNKKDLLMLKVFASYHAIFPKQNIYLKIGLLKYWQLKILKKTSLPYKYFWTKIEEDVVIYSQNSDKFFARPCHIANLTSDKLDLIYDDYYGE